MTKTYIDELGEEIAKLREENKRLKEENRALATGSFPLMIEGANKIEKLKELLKECGRQLEEVELYRYDVADVDQEDWFRISTEQAGIAKKMKAKIDEALK